MPLLDKSREQYGIGPVCSELHIAPSTYYHCQQQRHHPDKRNARAQRDDWLKKKIPCVYDVRKVWRQLLREGIRVARCLQDFQGGSCNSILRCPSISDGRLSYQFSSDGYIRRSVYAYNYVTYNQLI